MNRPLAFITVILCAACATGCAPHSAPVIPPFGMIYTHYKAPLTTDFDRTDIADKKMGQSTTYFFKIPNPWVDVDFAWDNASIERAAAQGQITKVAYADYEVLSIFGIFVRFTTTTYGD